MAEEQHETENETEFTNDNFVQLRNAHKEAQRELKELRAFKDEVEPRLRSAALKDAGFDPESPQATAVLELHKDGDLSGDALKETASKYGLTPGDGEPSPQELTPEQQQAIASSERGAQVQALGTPADPPQTLDAQIQAAEAKGHETGDWAEFDRLQAVAISR